jgi:hypothetical protein
MTERQRNVSSRFAELRKQLRVQSPALGTKSQLSISRLTLAELRLFCMAALKGDALGLTCDSVTVISKRG